MSNSYLVYSTESGRIEEIKKSPLTKSDDIIRIRRESSGRKGKGVCVITGLDLNKDELMMLTAELKKKCGSGGSVKQGNIEIQGDRRELIKKLLEAKGMIVKLAGG
ncbi:MAG: stress response translation initiation inhibitor YciH [Candidatus Phlomobacter fragariae]